MKKFKLASYDETVAMDMVPEDGEKAWFILEDGQKVGTIGRWCDGSWDFVNFKNGYCADLDCRSLPVAKQQALRLF